MVTDGENANKGEKLKSGIPPFHVDVTWEKAFYSKYALN